MIVLYLLFVNTQYSIGLLAHIDDNAVLVVSHIVNHSTIEDGLIAQHRIAHLLLTQLFVGNIAGGTDDMGGTPVFVATPPTNYAAHPLRYYRPVR